MIQNATFYLFNGLQHQLFGLCMHGENSKKLPEETQLITRLSNDSTPYL